MRQQGEGNFVAELIEFLQAFQWYLKQRAEQEYPLVQKLANSVKAIRTLMKPGNRHRDSSVCQRDIRPHGDADRT